jgi:predicted DNA-binding ribbon-helix-helix protein
MHGYFTGAYARQYRVWKRDGSHTSVCLEPEVLSTMRYFALREGISVQEVFRRIAAIPRHGSQSYASAIRCYVIRQLMQEVFDLSANSQGLAMGYTHGRERIIAV